MTQRIPLEDDDLIITQNNEYSVDNGLLIQGNEEFCNQLKQQILDDCEKAELYDKIPKVIFTNMKPEVEYKQVRTKQDKQNSKIVDEIRKKYNWCMDNPSNFNGKLAYELQSLLKENES